jgi:signal recognition particle receptor subunit beta
MPFINLKDKEINCKIVYYGPGLSGKTTNVKWIYERVKPEHRGELITLSTEGEKAIFFDFVPIEMPEVDGFKVRFHLYTTPGQTVHKDTRRMILKSVDGVVFVADSQEERLDANVASLDDLLENLDYYGIKVEELPLVFQYNKRDLPTALPVEVLHRELNHWDKKEIEAIAIKGIGVAETFKEITRQVIEKIGKDGEEAALKDS